MAPWLMFLAACGGSSDSGTADAATPAPPPAASGTCDILDFNAQMLARINAFRASAQSCGTSGNFTAAPALAWNDKLTQAAAGHSQDMATKNYFSHTSQDGRSVSDRVAAVGYTWSQLGENIAAGQNSIDSVMTTWQNSAGHCANLMSKNFTQVGVACVPGATGAAYSRYWTMDLGKP
ncbi:CAP domain-containing protein [Rhizobacter sp. P5_C2]